MSEFSLVAMGGTFDLIHKGHKVLLSKAFGISDKVLIGLTSDKLAAKKGKTPINNYVTRLKNLKSTIYCNFVDPAFEISKLDDDFGPAVLQENVKALILSGETSTQGEALNKLRLEHNLLAVEIVIVPMFLARDGIRVSSTRIKNSEIDTEGNVISVDK